MNPAETVLLENINKPNSRFIFPTDIAASRWADHVLRIMANLHGGTVAMDKFTAWDVFKQNSIKSKVQNKKSIPPALRKIFINRLVKENAEKCNQGKVSVFSSLIRAQWADQAPQLSPWLVRILPQLGVWFNKITGLSIHSILDKNAERATYEFEGDDRDLFVLVRRYAQFLEEHGLFEPAWETPPFNDEGMDCFIFFSESLSDFNEYRELLEASGHVKTISVSDTANLMFDSFFYTNSRSEITEAALYIRALHEKHGISWDSIAVCIPDSQNYEPYLIREFTNRNIPFVKRISKPLADYPAGRFFRSVLDCTSQDFSFSSLASLIMNKNLPWKDTAQINKLITFGIDNNCLFSWLEKTDGKDQYINTWEDAFVKPFGRLDLETRKFFEHLKRRLQTLRSADSFSELRRQYFSFREQFLDMKKCSEETDIILSRCISELMNLVELEKDFPNVKASDPFSFFTEYLSEVLYLSRQKTSGVAILPYKTAAAAPFDCHIILGAGQDNMSVVYSHLDFLPRKKREELGILDEDASSVFINLHKYNSVKIAAFFCSERTFSGFTVPHSEIRSPSEPKDRYAADAKLKEKFSPDHYSEESSVFASFPITQTIKFARLYENQINGFTEWEKRQKQSSGSGEKWNTNGKIQESIRSIYLKNKKYSVSSSSLQVFFQCSLKWLFERVFKLGNVQIETSLMAENLSGLVYHAILNHFFTELKNKNETLLKPVYTDFGLSLPAAYQKLLEHCVNAVFDCFPALKLDGKTQMSALTARLLRAGKNDFQYHLESCIARFLSFFSGCRVAASEISYQLERDSFLLGGIVDCILKEPPNEPETSGKYIIIDFKLKNLPDRDDCTGEGENGLSNFQLPMYITLTEENEKVKIYTALFYSILEKRPELLIGTVKDVNTGNVFPKKEDDIIIRDSELYNRIFDEFNKKTKQFSQEISTGNFTIFESKNNNCFNCDYRRICRTAYVIKRNKAISLEKY